MENHPDMKSMFAIAMVRHNRLILKELEDECVSVWAS